MTSISKTTLQMMAALEPFRAAKDYRQGSSGKARRENLPYRETDVALLAVNGLNVYSAPWYCEIITAARNGDLHAATLLQIAEEKIIFEKPADLGLVVAVGESRVIAGLKVKDKLRVVLDVAEARLGRDLGWYEQDGLLQPKEMKDLKAIVQAISSYAGFSVTTPKFNDCENIAKEIKGQVDFNWFRCFASDGGSWGYDLVSELSHEERELSLTTGPEGVVLIISS